MCFIRSKVGSSADESAPMSAHIDRPPVPHIVNRYRMLFPHALGHDIDGQTVGLDGDVVQMATPYNSEQSNAVA